MKKLIFAITLVLASVVAAFSVAKQTETHATAITSKAPTLSTAATTIPLATAD